MKHKRSMKHTRPGSGINRRAIYIALCFLILFGNIFAQDEVKTTTNSTDTQATDAQKNEGDYEIKSSVEVGVRGKKILGDLNKYRSDLNYGAGVRLFDSSFLVKAKDSAGKPFDSLLLTGSGWDADPNGNFRANMEKLGWYNFDTTIRRYEYFNSISNFALGQHTRNTRRNMGDFDVTILPQNENIRFRLGYSYNTNKGPAAVTYDYDRDEFPIKSDYDSRSDDVRFGVDGKILGFNLSFTEGYRRFRDNTSFLIDSPQLGNNPNPRSSISTFSRLIPETGKSFYHSFTAHRSFAKRFDFTGRIIYSSSTSEFTMVEKLTGLDRSGNPVILNQSDSAGDSKRPHLVGDVGFTALVTDKFRISNTFSVNSYRITGGNVLLELLRRTNAGGTPLPDTNSSNGVYRFTNFRRYMNTIEGDYDVNRFFSAYLGYRYANRSVTLEGVDTNILNQTSSAFSESGKNTTNSVLAGFKASPIPKKWTINLDLEHGQADNAFTRLGNYDSTNLRLRSRIKPVDELSINLSMQIKDNKNPSRSDTIPPTSFNADSNSRNFGVNIDWTPDPRAYVSGGFSHNRVNSLAAVIFPVSGTGLGQGLSRYRLRNNFFNLDGWFQPQKVVSFFVSYRISKDTGQGDFFDAANYLIEGNYPLSFQSPEARVTFRLHNRVDMNFGYQYYNYNERIPNSQNYRAHLPYGSLRIYLGRSDR